MPYFDIKGTHNLIQQRTAFINIDPKLRRVLTKRLRVAVQPARAAIKASAMETLPAKGGLNARVAASRIGTRATVTGKNANIRLVTSNKYAIAKINSGRLRHPLWGNRKHWYSQEVPEGFWDKAIEGMRPELERAAAKALDDTIKELRRR